MSGEQNEVMNECKALAFSATGRSSLHAPHLHFIVDFVGQGRSLPEVPQPAGSGEQHLALEC